MNDDGKYKTQKIETNLATTFLGHWDCTVVSFLGCKCLHIFTVYVEDVETSLFPNKMIDMGLSERVGLPLLFPFNSIKTTIWRYSTTHFLTNPNVIAGCISHHIRPYLHCRWWFFPKRHLLVTFNPLKSRFI